MNETILAIQESYRILEQMEILAFISVIGIIIGVIVLGYMEVKDRGVNQK